MECLNSTCLSVVKRTVPLAAALSLIVTGAWAQTPSVAWEGRPIGSNELAYSPDGAFLAHGGTAPYNHAFNTCVIRRTSDYAPVRTLFVPNSVQSVTYSNDGQLLAVGCYNKNVYVYNAATGALLQTLAHTGAIERVRFSPVDRNLLAVVAEAATIRLFNAETGALVREFGWVESRKALDFSDDGTRLATGGMARTLQVYNVATGALLENLGQGGIGTPTHRCSVWSADFQPGSNTIVIVGMGPNDRTCRIWNLDTNTNIETVGAGERNPFVHWLADGSAFVAASWDGNLRSFNGATGALIRTYTGQVGSVNGMDIHPVSGQIASAGRASSSFALWNFGSSSPAFWFSQQIDNVTSLHFSLDNQFLAVGTGNATRGQISIYNRATGAPIRTLVNGHTNRVNDVKFNNDGTRLASAGADGQVRIWNTSTGAIVATLTRAGSGAFRSLSWSRDGSRLVTGAEGPADSEVVVWNTTTWTPAFTYGGVSGAANGVAFTKRNVAAPPEVAIAGADGVLRQWFLLTNVVQTFAQPTGTVVDVEYSPDGTRLVSGGSAGTAWILFTGSRAQQASATAPSAILSVDYNATGARIVTGLANRNVELHDNQGVFRGRYNVGGWPLTSVAFSANGQQFAVGTTAPSFVVLNTL